MTGELMADVELVEVRFPFRTAGRGRVTVWLSAGDPDRGLVWVERADLDAGRVDAEATGRTATQRVARWRV